MGREPVTDTKIVDTDASDTGKMRDEQEEGETILGKNEQGSRRQGTFTLEST